MCLLFCFSLHAGIITDDIRYALMTRDLELAFTLSKSANPSVLSSDLITIASKNRLYKFIEFLICRGVQPTDAQFTYAVEQNDSRLLNCLLLSGVFPKQCLSPAIKNKNEKIVRQLLASYVNPDERKTCTLTPLGTAVREDNVEIAELLLSKGAEPLLVNVQECKSERMREIICRAYDFWLSTTHIIDNHISHNKTWLLKKLFNNAPATRIIGHRILHHSIKKKKMFKIKSLCKTGLSVNTYYKGTTALHAAVKKGHFNTIRLLLHNGATPTLPDYQGRLPFELNSKNEDWELVQLLLQLSTHTVNAAV